MRPPNPEASPCANYYERKRCTTSQTVGFGQRCDYCTQFNTGRDMKENTLPQNVTYDFPPCSNCPPSSKKASSNAESSRSGGAGMFSWFGSGKK